MKYYKFFLVSLGVIIIDQLVKMIIHFNLELGVAGQIVVFGDWFKIHYVLNPGMAFGLELPRPYGKILLSIFRMLAVIGIAYYLKLLIDKQVHRGLLICIALILGGAIGNVVDSTFYGVLLDNAPEGSPTPWFHGQVVDMFYIDIWEGILPEWVPLLGGKYYSFWPIFNIADASIFVGVFTILIFQGRFFPKPKKEEDNTTPTPETNVAKSSE
ncbi:MAG: lipoprotein signal peptidase [Thermonemataceae bacterium]